MKIADVGIVFTKYGIKLAVVNKRGNPKAGGVDVTVSVLDQLMDLLKSEDGKIMSYTRADGKRYEIKVHELTEEECAERDEASKLKSERSKAKMQRMLPLLGMFGAMDDPFSGVIKPKILEQGLFTDLVRHLVHTRSFSHGENFEKYIREAHRYNYVQALHEGTIAAMWKKASSMDMFERNDMNDWDWIKWFRDEFDMEF
jgi:hypothetical protein